MNIITLTTDAGEKDHYVASLKGEIFSNSEDVNVIDISHQIKPFDVGQAALQLNNCISSFPKGTIHIVGVDDEPIITPSIEDCSHPCIMKYKEQFFIAVDNGFFGCLVGEDSHEDFYVVTEMTNEISAHSFSTKNILIPIALKVLAGEDFLNFSAVKKRFKSAYTLGVFLEPNIIKGYVVHIDAYGNLISNIKKEQFDVYKEFAAFTIYYRNKEYFIEQISNTYHDVSPGEKLALFNSNNYLEIAINRGASRLNGGAEQLFGVRTGDMIRIEFTTPGSHKTIDSLF